MEAKADVHIMIWKDMATKKKPSTENKDSVYTHI